MKIVTINAYFNNMSLKYRHFNWAAIAPQLYNCAIKCKSYSSW